MVHERGYGGYREKKGKKKKPCKVKFALPKAFVEDLTETDISTHTDATACRNFDVDSVSLLTSHFYVNDHGAYTYRKNTLPVAHSYLQP